MRSGLVSHMMPVFAVYQIKAGQPQPQWLSPEKPFLPDVKNKCIPRARFRIARALIDGMEDFSLPTELVEEAAEVSEMTSTLEPFPEEAGVASTVLDLPAQLLEDPLQEIPDPSGSELEAVEPHWYEQVKHFPKIQGSHLLQQWLFSCQLFFSSCLLVYA